MRGNSGYLRPEGQMETEGIRGRSRTSESTLYTSASIRYRRLLFFEGAVAQLVEHHVRNVGAESSNLVRSTI